LDLLLPLTLPIPCCSRKLVFFILVWLLYFIY
jgi:hypothetical protein